MIAALIMVVAAAGLAAGLLAGFSIGTTRTTEALKRARYEDAIALAGDLVKTPDALDLRDRAQKILAAHRAANPGKDT